MCNLRNVLIGVTMLLTPAFAQEGGLKLTMEQSHTIKELLKEDGSWIIADPAKLELKEGATVPEGTPMAPIPIEVANKISSVSSHLYTRAGETILLLSKSGRIDAIIE